MTPRQILILTLTLLVAGCALPVKREPPDFAAPASWSETLATDSATVDSTWWQAFNSNELEELVATTLRGSPDLRMATERVLQADIALRSSRSSLFPAGSITMNTAAGRDYFSDGTEASTESSRAGLAINYEIDVWGSNFAAWQGDKASFAATRHDYAATRLSLIAAVANAYWQVLSTRERLTIARRNLEIAERLFTIVEARYRFGTASALDLSRQRTTVMAQRDALLPLEVQERQNLRALALLVGAIPQQFEVDADHLDAIIVPEIAPVLPGELLVRRPDIAAAEERLQAAHANIAVARAALFPLKLNLGLSSLISSGEFAFAGLGSPLHSADLVLDLTRALFDGGRLRGQLQIRESERRALVESWRKTVLVALKEVEDALAVVQRSRRQEQTQRQIRDETARALHLSELRYKEGSDSLTTLLDAQRSLFAVEEQLMQQKLTRLTAAVDLYKALGGGWELPPAVPQPEETP